MFLIFFLLRFASHTFHRFGYITALRHFCICTSVSLNLCGHVTPAIIDVNERLVILFKLATGQHHNAYAVRRTKWMQRISFFIRPITWILKKNPKICYYRQLSVCDRCLIVHSAVGQSIGCACVSRVNLIQQTIIIGTSCLGASSLLPELMHQHYMLMSKSLHFSTLQSSSSERYTHVLVAGIVSYVCHWELSCRRSFDSIDSFSHFINIQWHTHRHRLFGHFKIF